MEIVVLQAQNGDTLPLKVKTSDTIKNVKLQISDKLDIPKDDQVLLYEQKLLEDSYTLDYYKILEKATLVLRRKAKGWLARNQKQISMDDFT